MKRCVMKKYFLILLLIYTLVFIFSCATQKGVLKNPEERAKTIFGDNLTISLKYIPEKILLDRFGSINNPFISPISFLKSNRLMTFELNIIDKNYSSILVNLNKIEIQFGSISKEPLNRFQLAQFWEPRLRKQPDYERWNFSILRSVINKNVFDNDTLIKEGEATAGLIVFKGAFPDYGKAVIYIPIFDGSGKMLKRYEVEVEFEF